MMESAPTPQAAAGPSTNTMALVSLIAGIVGLTILPFVGSIVAVITGNIGRKEIAASAGAQTGDGMALAGLIMGWIGVGLGVIGICLACLFLVLLPLGIFRGINQSYGLLTPFGMWV